LKESSQRSDSDITIFRGHVALSGRFRKGSFASLNAGLIRSSTTAASYREKKYRVFSLSIEPSLISLQMVKKIENRCFETVF